MNKPILIFTVLKIINVFCQEEPSTVEKIFGQENGYNSTAIQNTNKVEFEGFIRKSDNNILGVKAESSIIRQPKYMPKFRSGTKNEGEKIYGGYPCPDKDYKTIVSVRLYRYPRKSHRCGGSLINELLVLTAAHCYNASEDKFFSVVAGITKSGYHKVEPAVKAVYPHPNYTRGFHSSDDIALFVLEKPIYQNHYITHIRLPTGNIDAFIKRQCSTVFARGWGLMEDRKYPLETNLQCVLLPLIDFDTCRQDHNNLKLMHGKETVICVKSKEEKSPCFADSGSPLTCQGIQIGLLSFGSGDRDIPECYAENAFVYTKVDFYLDWIQNLKDSIKSEGRGLKTKEANTVMTKHIPLIGILHIFIKHIFIFIG